MIGFIMKDAYFLSTIKDKIKASRISDDMASVCFAIIDYLSTEPNKKSHLTFSRLYEISPKVDDETFYDAVFLLTKNKFGVLEQHFEALDGSGNYKSVTDRQQILDDIKEQEFFNPFTGDELSEEQFGEQVLTFFSPTQKLIQAVSHV